MKKRMLAIRQPSIPAAVDDVEVGREWHPRGYWVMFIRSHGQGPREWMRKWADAPPGVIQAPDSVEYYREICPVGTRKNPPDLVRADDGYWYWQWEEA